MCTPISRLVGALGMAAWLCACGADASYVTIGTARAPSTSGTVELEELDGGSSLVTVHLEFLHPPARTAEGATCYVLWFQGPVGAPLRAGMLRYDPETRTGDLSAAAPWSSLIIKVTAEREENPSAPSESVIATQAVAIED
jgi:hypothetical protein